MLNRKSYEIRRLPLLHGVRLVSPWDAGRSRHHDHSKDMQMKQEIRPKNMAPLLNADLYPKLRPVWKDDYGSFRIAHTSCMVQMLDDLGISDRAF